MFVLGLFDNSPLIEIEQSTEDTINDDKVEILFLFKLISKSYMRYAMTGQLTQKSDVYSFGVVLLELLTGRKPVDHTMPRGQQSLVTWATPRLSEEKVLECVDPRLKGEYPPKAAAKLAAVAALCVQYEADFRPNMSIVAKALSALGNKTAPRPSAVAQTPNS
ncbi:hypothetical protein ZIOFF_057001 [Zingiber officinale]|uniref:Serine-threonine/tyrosine-protein kinase catalytic domain-containing protein n=1 Tax=Zingiber officinale TaxID=94328 RepID=A0A8J5FPJ9_ZINOF|nr:hypothetical protein ZIOFF_057001 [Zingiber officinale]